MSEIKVKLVRSRIGCNPKQRAILDALGLKRREMVKVHNDTSSIRGMIRKVVHLVCIVD